MGIFQLSKQPTMQRGRVFSNTSLDTEPMRTDRHKSLQGKKNHPWFEKKKIKKFKAIKLHVSGISDLSLPYRLRTVRTCFVINTWVFRFYTQYQSMYKFYYMIDELIKYQLDRRVFVLFCFVLFFVCFVFVCLFLFLFLFCFLFI